MTSKKKDLEIVYNLQWKNKDDKSNMVGMYDIPATTLNWDTFKSYLLKNSGTAGDDVKVSYIDSDDGEIAINSQVDFQIALYWFRQQARIGEIITLKLDRLDKRGILEMKQNKQSADVKVQVGNEQLTNGSFNDGPPEWFIKYMKNFKEEIVEEIATSCTSLRPAALGIHHARKKAESYKRNRKTPLLIADTNNDKEIIKSSKLERKLDNKLEKLEHKTMKIKIKKMALNCSSDSDGRGCSSGHATLQTSDSELLMNASVLNVGETVTPRMFGGEVFLQTWKIVNNGKLPWTNETELRYAWGSQAFTPLKNSVPCPCLQPGETGSISVSLLVPRAPGSYECYWHFHHNGSRFGHWLGCQIIVNEPPIKTAFLLKLNDTKSFKDIDKGFGKLLMDGDVINERKSVIPHMVGGGIFVQTWKIVNKGKLPWTNQTTLRFVSGSHGITALEHSIPCPLLQPGQVGVVCVSLDVPSTPGTYECFWQFYHDGRHFGEQLDWKVIVDEPTKDHLCPLPSPTYDVIDIKNMYELVLPSSWTSNSKKLETEKNSTTENIKSDENNSVDCSCDAEKIAELHTTDENKMKEFVNVERKSEGWCSTDQINSSFENLKIKSNVSSDTDNQSVISVSESNTSISTISSEEYVLVRVSDSQDKEIKIDTYEKTLKKEPLAESFENVNIGKVSEFKNVTVDLNPSKHVNVVVEHVCNLETANADNTESMPSTKKLKLQDLPIDLSNKSDAEKGNFYACSGYAYVNYEGRKVPIAKKFLRPDYLKNAEDAPDPKTVMSDDASNVSRKLEEQCNCTQTNDFISKPSSNFSHCSAMGSTYSDNISNHNRFFVFPYNNPGYEVVDLFNPTNMQHHYEATQFPYEEDDIENQVLINDWRTGQNYTLLQLCQNCIQEQPRPTCRSSIHTPDNTLSTPKMGLNQPFYSVHGPTVNDSNFFLNNNINERNSIAEENIYEFNRVCSRPVHSPTGSFNSCRRMFPKNAAPVGSENLPVGANVTTIPQNNVAATAQNNVTANHFNQNPSGHVTTANHYNQNPSGHVTANHFNQNPGGHTVGVSGCNACPTPSRCGSSHSHTDRFAKKNIVQAGPVNLFAGAAYAATSAMRTAKNMFASNVGRWENGHWISTNYESKREKHLRKLNEMGFCDRDLNATLLARYNDDLIKVILELID